MPWRRKTREKTSEDEPAIPTAPLNLLVELFGEELLELALLLLWLLVTTFWKQLLIAAGGALLVTFILAAFLGGLGGEQPRSLFSYDSPVQGNDQQDRSSNP